jgi:GT2 family glycosyltransferase
MAKANKMAKLTIGALTYNDTVYSLAWLDSVLQNLPDSLQVEARIVLVDDGTPSAEIKDKLRQECQENDVLFIEHGVNRGIPAGWNTIARAFPKTSLICVFNNDTRITSPDTFPCAVYFMESNPQVGASSWPTVYVYPNGDKSNWFKEGEYPAVVRQPFGYGFFFTRQAYEKTGEFWEELLSFLEESDFGYELYKAGYQVMIMPYPSIEHWPGCDGLGHYTFSHNPELKYWEGEKRDVRARRMFVDKWGLPPEGELEKAYVKPIQDKRQLIYWMDIDKILRQTIIPTDPRL